MWVAQQRLQQQQQQQQQESHRPVISRLRNKSQLMQILPARFHISDSYSLLALKLTGCILKQGVSLKGRWHHISDKWHHLGDIPSNQQT